MSRIGKKPVIIPSGVKVELKGQTLSVTGPKGTLELEVHPKVKLNVTAAEVNVEISNKESKREKALWGLFRSLVQNMVDGVAKGFEKKLEVIGVGFKVDSKKADEYQKFYTGKKADAIKQGNPTLENVANYSLAKLANLSGMVIEMQLGFSHPVFAEVPAALTAVVEKNFITITGASKQAVGQFAAEIRELKKPEPYKGKGIKYSDETVIRKAGKVVKVVGGGK